MRHIESSALFHTLVPFRGRLMSGRCRIAALGLSKLKRLLYNLYQERAPSISRFDGTYVLWERSTVYLPLTPCVELS